MPAERCLACMKLLETGKGTCPNCGATVPCAPNPEDCLQPGYILDDRFVIGRVIGRGGYGISYIAFDNRLQAVRCIKEYFPTGYGRKDDMSPDVEPGKEADFNRFSDRFLQEARIMTSLSTDKVRNVVNVYDQLNLNGTTYILMEYLDGCTLDEWITRRQEPLTWQEACQTMKTVLQTMEEIHGHGYLHRDLSLSNIFRLQDGTVRVIDFGSAEPVDRAKKRPGEMQPSSKKYYSPEEQVKGSAQGPWTDVYAAGVCLFKMAAGGWPQNLKSGEAYPSLNSLNINAPEALDRVIGIATAPDPHERYQSAAEMLQALNRVREEAAREPWKKALPVSQSQPIEPHPVSQWQNVKSQAAAKAQEPAKKKGKKGLLLVIAALAVIAVAVAIILAGAGNGGKPKDKEAPYDIVATPDPMGTANDVAGIPETPAPENRIPDTPAPAAEIPDTPEP